MAYYKKIDACSSTVGRQEAVVGVVVAVALGRAAHPTPKSILSCGSRQIRVHFLSTVEMVVCLFDEMMIRCGMHEIECLLNICVCFTTTIYHLHSANS
jgi:hypothetical protein